MEPGDRARWRWVLDRVHVEFVPEMRTGAQKTMDKTQTPTAAMARRGLFFAPHLNSRQDYAEGFFRQSRRRTKADRTSAEDDNEEWRKKHPHKLPTVRARGNQLA
jgi:hypothetical protein